MTGPATPGVRPATPVLLLSGAGLPEWIWDDVRAALPPGTDSLVVRPERGPGASLADCADAAAEQAPWGEFAVVAHSLGGTVAAELIARHPARVTAVLGVAAAVPRPGHSFVRSLPAPARWVVPTVLRRMGTRPPDRSLRPLTRGLPGAVADRLVREFDPEPLGAYLDPNSPRTLPPVRAYLRTGNDPELSAAVQRRSAAALEARWTQELPTGHLPMLESPDGVSRAVHRLLAEVDRPAVA